MNVLLKLAFWVATLSAWARPSEYGASARLITVRGVQEATDALPLVEEENVENMDLGDEELEEMAPEAKQGDGGEDPDDGGDEEPPNEDGGMMRRKRRRKRRKRMMRRHERWAEWAMAMGMRR